MKRKILILAFACFTLSCSQDKVEINESTSNLKATKSDVEIYNGILKFKSKEHLRDVTNELGKMPVKDMEDWFSENEFKSLLARQNEVTEGQLDLIVNKGEFGENKDLFFFFKDETGDLVLKKTIDDERLAAVLNHEGFLIIGDEIHHVGKDEVTTYDNFSSFSKSRLDKNYSEGKKTPMTVTYSIDKTSRGGRVSSVPAGAMYSDKFHIEDANRRMRAEFISRNSIIYQSLQIKVEFQKKNWIGWSGAPAKYLGVEASGTFGFSGGPSIPYSVSKHEYNVSEVGGFADEYYGDPTYNLTWFTKNGIGYYHRNQSSSEIYYTHFN